MRNAFADEITQIAKSDPSVVLLSGDIGNRLFDKYKESNPERFVNCGVAEDRCSVQGSLARWPGLVRPGPGPGRLFGDSLLQ